jgi:polysaccharide export outer membrane protein
VVALLALGGCAQSPAVQPLPPLDSVRVVAVSSEYRIQGGDVLRIKFAYHPEHDVKLPVRPDGKITLDVTGEIDAGGLTAAELEAVIKARSSRRLREPEVSVIVAQLGEQKVYVGGEVRVPGFVAYRPGLTPLQAIFDRGGFTDTARVDSVLHITPGETEYQATRLDLTEAVDHGMAEPVLLVANDVVYVPRTWVGDAGSFVQLYIRNLLPIPPRFGFSP